MPEIADAFMVSMSATDKMLRVIEKGVLKKGMKTSHDVLTYAEGKIAPRLPPQRTFQVQQKPDGG